MVTVALIGADGAGKTTVGRALEENRRTPVKYLYMGVNAEASNHALPTTRVLRALKNAAGKGGGDHGPPDPSKKKRGGSLQKRVLRGAKTALVLSNRLCEEWYRQLVAWYYQRRGYVVLFDRHFYADYYAHDVSPRNGSTASGANGSQVSARRSLGQRLHGFALRFYPRPDLVVLLDASAEELFRRKGEGTIELLEKRRREYLLLGEELDNFEVVDATLEADQVRDRVLELIAGLKGARA